MIFDLFLFDKKRVCHISNDTAMKVVFWRLEMKNEYSFKLDSLQTTFVCLFQN